jgi:hypothetical protein
LTKIEPSHDILLLKQQAQTIEKEYWSLLDRKKQITYKSKGRNSNTYLGQSRLQTYIDQKRLRRTLHTNKRGNTLKENNSYQPICTQHQCTQFHQTYSEEPKNIYRLQHGGSGGLKYPPIPNR